MTEEVTAWLEDWAVSKLMGELGIRLSEKDAETQPFPEVFSAIGAAFDAMAGAPKVSPNQPVTDKLRLMSDK